MEELVGAAVHISTVYGLSVCCELFISHCIIVRRDVLLKDYQDNTKNVLNVAKLFKMRRNIVFRR